MSLSTPRPRVALIGVSGYGRIYYEFLKEYHAAGLIELAAAVVIDSEKEKLKVAELAALGCRIYGDFREMLAQQAGRLDLCGIPTGTPWHAPMALAALEAGANVLVEKPLAATVAEVRAMQAAEAKTGRTVLVGFQYLYQKENLDLQRVLAQGAIGTVRRVRVLGLWPRGSDYYTRNNWAGRILSAGAPVFDSPVSNAFAHQLSLALFFAGNEAGRSASPVRVASELYRAQPIENYDTAALRIETDSGATVHFYASHSVATTFDPEIVIEGSNGRAVWRHLRDYRLEVNGRPSEAIPLNGEEGPRRTMFEQVIGRFSDPSLPYCGTATALEHTRCVEAAQASGAITDVPAGFLAHGGETAEGRFVWIRDLETLMRRAFADGSSLTEAGCPWSRPPVTMTVSGLPGA